MKSIELRKLFKKTLVIFLFLVLACLWLKELTERRARQAADQFLGPMLEQLDWLGDSFMPLAWRDSMNRKHRCTWNVSYEGRSIITDFPFVVEVDLFGRVRGTSFEKFNRWITLSDSGRRKEQMKLIEAFELERSKR